MNAVICCEGPDCNDGRSAIVREAEETGDVRNMNEEVRDEYHKASRQIVSRALAVTMHTRSSVTRRAGIAFAIYACDDCGHERIYGNSVSYLAP